MDLPLQLFGTVETTNGIANAMLCRDSDRPEEAMFHWWGKDIQSTAALMQLKHDNQSSISFSPIKIYTTNASGGLFIKILEDKERELIQGFHASIHENAMKNGYTGKWENSEGSVGEIKLSSLETVPDITPQKCSNWLEFKEWATATKNNNTVSYFRGHGSNTFRLKTTLHRTGRSRIEKYCSETLVEFRGHAEAILGMRLNTEDSHEYSMLLGLAQHHGLPTPLLDWTASPYIAAFFAFADAIESASSRPNTTHVRVYSLTQKFLEYATPPMVTLPYISPYTCFLSITARNNPRLYAQQGHFLVSNVIDIEQYILGMEQKDKLNYLIAADIPISCAIEALDDLRYMGLTAATLFPGLDGVCRMMKHQMTSKRPQLPTAGKPSNSEQGKLTIEDI